jgi:hypothetical protein
MATLKRSVANRPPFIKRLFPRACSPAHAPPRADRLGPQRGLADKHFTSPIAALSAPRKMKARHPAFSSAAASWPSTRLKQRLADFGHEGKRLAA